MSTKVPIGKGVKEEEEASSVVFIGPTAAGKTTSLILLHQTLIDYREDMNCVYMPVVRNSGFDLYRETNNLILSGIPPAPTNPNIKDAKIELDLQFRSRLRSTKKVKLIFADMSGGISKTVMKVFPELISSTPKEVNDRLLQAGLSPEDVEYLVHSLLTAKGIILVADSSKLGEPDTPDSDLAAYLDNLNQFSRAHGENPKGVALLLTKWDQWKIQGLSSPSETELFKLARNYLPQVDNFATNFNKMEGTKYKIFYSMLVEQRNSEDKLLFNVVKDNARHQRRVEYSVMQYRRLAEWLRDTFGT